MGCKKVVTHQAKDTLPDIHKIWAPNLVLRDPMPITGYEPDLFR